MYEIILTDRATNQLRKLPKDTAHRIAAKINWLAQHAETVSHERLGGHREYSLHSGPYRIPYSLDHMKRLVIIEDIDQHDAAYRRLHR